jgi:hypothetical protein
LPQTPHPVAVGGVASTFYIQRCTDDPRALRRPGIRLALHCLPAPGGGFGRIFIFRILRLPEM